MLYAAKCYWPGVSETALERAAAHAVPAGDTDVSFLGSLLFPGDELVLCFFEADSGTACVMPSVWLAPTGKERSAAP
jgi:hypothetical protein